MATRKRGSGKPRLNIGREERHLQAHDGFVVYCKERNHTFSPARHNSRVCSRCGSYEPVETCPHLRSRELEGMNVQATHCKSSCECGGSGKMPLKKRRDAYMTPRALYA